VLIFIEHGTRRLHIAGATAHPSGAWVAQQARNVALHLDQRLESLAFLIRDRDSKFTTAFDAVFAAEGIRILKSPPQAPKANAVCERMVGTVRRELLDRVLVVNARQLLRLLATYAMHCNQHRPHQARQQRPPDTTAVPVHSVTHLDTRRIRRHPVPGSTINEYRHAA
jgi:putative transposase